MPAVRPGARRATLALLPLFAAVLLLLAASATGDFLPGPAIVSVYGIYYSVTTATCNELYNCSSLMQTSAAWGQKYLSQQLALAVGASLGTAPCSDYDTYISGPLFMRSSHLVSNAATEYSSCQAVFVGVWVHWCLDYMDSDPGTIAIATVLPSSPGPSLDCGAAAFAPSVLESRRNGQICATHKAMRQAKPAKLTTNVSLSLPGASIEIHAIVTNQPTAGKQCRCHPRQGNCSRCLPNAVLLGGGNFMVMPQGRRNTLPGRAADTTLRVYFTATAGNGSTCNGAATICSSWGVRRNGAPPACTGLNSSAGNAESALTCI